MLQTTYQPPELYNSSGEIIRAGAFGPNTPFYKDTGDGVYDYIANDLEFLYNMIQAEIVPVTSLPASGDTSKIYLVTAGANAGMLYIWTGTEWQEQSNEEVVTRAEEAVADAAELLEQVQALIAASTVNALWDAETEYEVGDCVMTADGSTYRCIQASLNNPPGTSPGYWAAITIVEPLTFEYDGSGDLMPVMNPMASGNWDIDGNDDIMPAL